MGGLGCMYRLEDLPKVIQRHGVCDTGPVQWGVAKCMYVAVLYYDKRIQN